MMVLGPWRPPFNSQLTMLDRASDRGELGSADSGADFGSSGPSREKQPAMAGAGKRGDMDDEIPF